MLFKVTSWGLLVVVWAWVVSTCRSIETTYEAKRPWQLIGAPEGKHALALAEWELDAPHPAVRFVGRHSAYVFPVGILFAAWCYAISTKWQIWSISEQSAGRRHADSRRVGFGIDAGLKTTMHLLICWFFAYMVTCVSMPVFSYPAPGDGPLLSFAVALAIAVFERPWAESKTAPADRSGS